MLAYDDLINGELAAYAEASAKIGGPCEEQAQLFCDAFRRLRDLLEIASGSKKPDGWPGAMPDNVMEIIQGVGGAIGAIGEIDGFKAGQLEYTKALGDGAGALSWVVMEPTPVPHCKEACDSMWFNGQKVLMKSKGSDENGVAWAKAVKALLEALPPYVKQFHTTGVAWNPKGGDAASFVPGQAVAGGGGGGGAAPAAAAPAEVGASVAEFDDVLAHITKFVALSTEIGGKVGEIGAEVDKCFKAQRAFLEMASQSKKPDGWPGCADILQPMSDCMMAIGEISDFGDQKNHTKMMGEGIQSAAWVAVEPTPVPHVKETLPASMFYGNKILVEFKGKDQKHIDWVNAWKDFLTDLADYIKRNHTTGVTWNPNGGVASAAGGAAPAPAPPPAPAKKGPGGPPPPPGPPPKLEDLEDKRASKKPAADTGALFADLNKGSGVTSGLRKVSKGKAASSKVVMKERKTKTKKKMGTPKCALDGRKWICEYFIDDRTGGPDTTITECGVKETVTIFRCVNAVVQIKGKINAILLDDCDKTSIVCSDVVSSIDIVNCNSVEVQTTGKVPTIAVDKTDGCQLYLGAETMAGDGPTIIMSKSSECNVTVPGATEEDDGIEQALPEQFSNTFEGGKWMTTPVTHG